ncbi:MAG: glycoside hydrolase family 3 protein [Spirochaetes bacterium]|nr:glycoside hydrolase family 3 protein [Spirochaetota bacterium]
MNLTNKYTIIFIIIALLIILGTSIILFNKQRLETFILTLTPSQKIGQLLMIAPRSADLDQGLAEMIKEYNIGNMKIFGKNFVSKNRLIRLISQAQNLSLKQNKGIPMFVATDQEGGWIAHLKKGFTIPPSPMAIGRTKDKKLAFLAGHIIASELAAAGINVNFAPVVDLDLNDKNWVIGPRAFSSDPEVVTQMANEFIKAHTKLNVMPVIKHFPGHGSLSKDSHNMPLTNYHDYETLKDTELLPFQTLSQSPVTGIMSSHIAFPGIVKYMEKVDRMNYRSYYYLPASLSRIMINRYIRHSLKARGLVFSDEMAMESIKQNHKLEVAVYMALKAGVNIVVLNQNYHAVKKVFQYLLEQYKKDKNFQKQVDDSLRKIIYAKAFLFTTTNPQKIFSSKIFRIKSYKIDKESIRMIGSDKNKKLARTLSYLTTDIVKNRKNLIPLREQRSFKKFKILVIAEDRGLFTQVRKWFPNCQFMSIKNITMDRIGRDKNDVILIGIKNDKYTYPIEQIFTKNKNIILINYLHPVNIKSLDFLDTIVNTYSAKALQIEAAVGVIFQGKNKQKKKFDEYLLF